MNRSVEEIIEAHGGVERWKSLQAIEAELSVHGFLFTVKHVQVMNRVRVRAAAQAPRFTFFELPKPGQTGELCGDAEVAVTDSKGKVLSSRRHPRSAFRGFRRIWYWDDLDFIYFGGYATWNYLVTPFIFLRHGFQFEELTSLKGASGELTRLRVTFPPDIPTHCRTQVFYFDAQRRLRRLDYTAEVVGRWAHAAHFCDEYRTFEGLEFATRRRVLPLPLGNRPLPGPTLVAIEVHDLRLIF